MSSEKKSSEKTTLRKVAMWLFKSGVGGALAAGIFFGILEIGSIRANLFWQGERQSAHEESQKADIMRIDAKNVEQDAKNAEQDAKNAAQDAKNAAQDAKNAAQDAKNAAQDTKSAENGEIIAKTLAILERNEKTLMQLVEKVYEMDTFLRSRKDSAGIDKEESAKNVSSNLPILCGSAAEHIVFGTK